MSDPHLPPELLDHTVDHLHDDPSTLKECSLVSKSWITRARTHLFAHIEFKNPKTLKSWKRTFPDPLNSPGYLTQTLSCSQSVTDKGVGDWIKGFSRVTYLEILGHGLPAAQAKVSFTPYHGFSPTLKSLRLEFSMLPTSKIFNLILSFPLLEDLIVVTYFGASTDGGGGTGRLLTAVQPSNPPKFTGSLDLFMRGGMGPIANRLLSLPGGINFREFTFTWFHKGDAQLITALVEECSHSLKSLKIACATDVGSASSSIDLSKATKLEDVALLSDSPNIQWILAALQTITADHLNLREVSFRAPCLPRGPAFTTNRTSPEDIKYAIGKVGYRQWSEFDHLLVQLSELHSICLKVRYNEHHDGTDCYCASSLLPGVASRRMIDLSKWE